VACRARHLAWAAIRQATGATYLQIATVWGVHPSTVERGVVGKGKHKQPPRPDEVARVLGSAT
jgi:hypothetical protein